MNQEKTEQKPSLWISCLGALGIVYGDIGTSPLYAFRECFSGSSHVPVTPENILGILSLITWSLIIVISIKYLVVVMQADNDGEGGILALLDLFARTESKESRLRYVMLLFGLFGAALLYGDGVITPAISVLSAIEGLDVATSIFHDDILPITIIILIGLFILQQFGTEKVGKLFAPVMITWFSVLALTGLFQIVHHPEVLVALNPYHGVMFFLQNGGRGFLVLGVVFLAVTGGEALYADMGHFGKNPIRITWFTFVLPALLLNYYGQGALLFVDESAAKNPFYHLVTGYWRYPLVGLATAATIVASQAVISGAFSLTMQAVQSGLLPRMEIRHTSDEEYGQVYVPQVNWMMMIATLGLVITFKTSGALASAYGIAITTTMVITTVLLYLVMRELWEWSRLVSILFCGLFMFVDVAFFSANVIKIQEGGWVPLTIAGGIVTIMTTWRRGRKILVKRIEKIGLNYEDFFESLLGDPPQRVPGTAIYLWSRPGDVPLSLVQNLKLNHVMHEQIIILHIVFERRPRVRLSEKIQIEEIRDDFIRLTLRFGFIQKPNVPHALHQHDLSPLKVDFKETVYVIGRETVLSVPGNGMARWRENLFVFLSRNAFRATSFFYLPPGRVLEIGTQVEI